MKSTRDRGVRASQSSTASWAGRAECPTVATSRPHASRDLDEQEPLGGGRGRRERLVRRAREIGAPLAARGAHVDAESVSMTQIRSPWATCSPGRARRSVTTPAPMRDDLVLHLHRLDHADQRSGRDLVAVGHGHLEDRPLHRTDDSRHSPPRRSPLLRSLCRRAASAHAGSGACTRTSCRRPSSSTSRTRARVARRTPSDAFSIVVLS